MRIYPTFKWQIIFIAVLWPALVFLHLHLSGWGTTLYIPIDPTPFKSYPYYNAYNMMVGCGLPVCGYQLTNYLHGVGNGLIVTTLDLFAATFLGLLVGALVAAVATVGVAVWWEVYELGGGVTGCGPKLFGTIQQVCTEALRIINDTVADIAYGWIAIVIVVAVMAVVGWRVEYH